MAVPSPAEARLRRRATELARQFIAGQLTLGELRAALRSEVQTAQTIALLRGTGGQRNREINAALRRILDAEYAEIDRLLALLGRQPDMTPDELAQRIAAFADTLEETEAEGERLTQQPASPLVPIAAGTALALLLARIGRRTPEAIPGAPVRVGQIDRAAFAALETDLQAAFDSINAQFANGQIDLTTWYNTMRGEIVRAHAQYAQLGKGAGLDAGDLERLNERIRRQWEFLNGWRDELAAGREMNVEAMQQRGRMYLDSAQASLWEASTAAAGMPILPAYPKEKSECRSNCRCYLRIEQTGANSWHVFWRLRPAEHCPQCLRRSEVWNPLRIENGVIQPYDETGLFV